VVRVVFTKNLQRHVECPPVEVREGTVGQVLEAVFLELPRVKGYVVDERGAVRSHMVVFVNGEQLADRSALSAPVPDGAEVYIMQALSGG